MSPGKPCGKAESQVTWASGWQVFRTSPHPTGVHPYHSLLLCDLGYVSYMIPSIQAPKPDFSEWQRKCRRH